ncbi:MAG: hypothetical protein PUE18_05960 [Firmicutes bacterium]|nr:hypothetical protein [Bacillota bacterium]
MAGFRRGDVVYIVENNMRVVPVEILSCAGGLYTVKIVGISGMAGAIRLKGHRLFQTEEAAVNTLTYREPKKTQYDYMDI